MDSKEFQLIYNRLFEKTNFIFVETREKDIRKCWSEDDYNNSAVVVAKTPDGGEALLTITKPYTASMTNVLISGKCSLVFNHVTSHEINQIFSHLNYTFLFETLDTLYSMGKEFNFFESMTFPQDFTFSTLYKVEEKIQTPKMAKVGKVNLSMPLYEKNVDRVNTVSTKNIILFIKYELINDELSPILSLTFPCGAKKNISFDLNLHPDFDYHSELIEIRKAFTLVITKHIDLLLKRHMNLKQKEIDAMPIEEKKQNLKIIEMSIF